MFGGIFEGLNDDQYSCCFRPIKGCRGHQRWLEGLVNSLSKADCADYVAVILRRHPQVIAVQVKFFLEFFSILFRHIFDVICLVF